MTEHDHAARNGGRDSANRSTSRRRTRIAATVALVVTIAVGLIVVRGFDKTIVTDVSADALYAIAALLFVVAIAPRLAWWPAALIASAWCVAVELFQLTGVPQNLGASFPWMRLLLGSGFDARDLGVYVVTLVLAAAALSLASSRQRRAGNGIGSA